MPKSPPKPIIASFLQDWNGRQSWAASQGIPYSDFTNVVKYDYNRMLTTGYKMSDTEAFDSLSALASGKNPFTTPADTTPTVFKSPWGAMENDLTGIVTGLFHAPQTIWEDVKSAAQGHFSGIAQLIPGEMDIKNLMSPQGRTWMTQHPISDILDLGGLGSSEVAIAADAARAADVSDLATSLVTPETIVRHGVGGALFKLGAQEAARMVAKIPDHPVSTTLRNVFSAGADNVNRVGTLRNFGRSEFLSKMVGTAGYLPHQGNIIRAISALNNIMSSIPAEDLYNPERLRNIPISRIPEGNNLIEMLFSNKSDVALPRIVNLEEYKRVSQMFTTGHDPVTGTAGERAMRLDDNIPANVRQAYSMLADMSHGLTQAEIMRGSLVEVTNPQTGDSGLEQPDGPYQKYLSQLTKSSQRLTKTSTAYNDAVKVISNGLAKIRALDDPRVPRAFRLPTDQLVTESTALQRISDYYGANADNLFRYPGWGTDRALTKAVTDTRRRFNMSIKRNFGPTGKLTDIVNRIGSLHDVTATASDLLKSIDSVRRAINRLNIVHDETFTYLSTTLSDIRRDVKEMSTAQGKLSALESAKNTAQKSADTLMKRNNLLWNRYVERPFAPLVQQAMHDKLLQFINDHYLAGEVVSKLTKDGTARVVTPEIVDSGIKSIEDHYYYSPDVKALISPQAWAAVRNDAYLMVNDFKEAGYEPLFVQAIRKGSSEQEAILHPTVMRTASYVHRSVEHSVVDPLSDSLYEPRFGIVREAQDIYKQSLVQHIIDNFVRPIAKTNDEMIVMAKNMHMTTNPSVTIFDTPTLAKDFADQMGYTAFDPTTIPELRSTRFTFGQDNRVWIKKYDNQLISRTFKSTFQEFNRAWSSAMSLYRIGVLYLSPRYFAHITFGGATMTMLRVNPLDLTPRMLNAAYHMAREGPSAFPSYMSMGVSEADLGGHLVSNPFSAHNYLVGRKLGKLLGESTAARVGNKALGYAKAYQTFLETISNTQRALAYLSGSKRADAADLTDADRAAVKAWDTTPEQWLGAKLANKVLADRMSQSPLDRTIIRMVMPFWGWTRHILRYVTTYPSDHPLKASILQAVSNEAIGANSQLPDYLFRLLYLGQPNAQGNVNVLDDRQWNPFRDVANYMNIGGFVSQLNPVWGALLANRGIDPVTGGPELYPSLTYDSFYGGTSAAGGNFLKEFAEQFSPQINSLVGIMQSTSSLRQQARKNPSKLPYLIADSLGMPWIPFTLNVKQERIQELMDEYKLASGAVTNALTNNTMADLIGYGGLLPLDDYEVNRQYIGAIINSANQVNAQSGTTIPATDLLALNYPLPMSPAYIEYASANQPAEGVNAL